MCDEMQNNIDWTLTLISFYTLYLPSDSLAETSEKCVQPKNISGGWVVEKVLQNYDKTILPERIQQTGGTTVGVNVTVELHIQEISSVSELTGSFELDLMYSEIWRDPRLSFANLSLCSTNFTLKSRFRNRIWIPDTCVINSKNASVHASPAENVFVILHTNGTVWANYRMKVNGPCKMNLRLFPFDRIFCSLILESYSFNSNQVFLQWYSTPITMMGSYELPGFDLESWQTMNQSVLYPNGMWDRLNVTFKFRRRPGYYLVQVYFPTFLTVITSWLGFFFEPMSVSGRVTLGLSSFLAICMQFGSLVHYLPRVSYIKVIDIWILTCVFFIFCSMMELAVVAQLYRLEKEKRIRKQSERMGRCLSNGEQKKRNTGLGVSAMWYRSENTLTFRRPLNKMKCLAVGKNATSESPVALPLDVTLTPYKYTARYVDEMSRLVFPLSFTLFLLVYWLYVAIMTHT